MKNVLITCTAVLLISFTGISQILGQRVEKNLKESFQANENTLIEIDSKFGEVKIVEGEYDRVDVKANIWVSSTSESKAEDLLSQLDAEISQNGNIIVVKSILPSKLNTGKSTQFRVDFEIHAPVSVNLDLSSRYGSVYIEENSGHVDISVSYGNIKIQELLRANEKPLNTLDLSYSSGSIEEAGWLKLNMAYSKLSIDEVHAAVALSKYSGLSVDECSSLVLDSKYDTYKIGEVNNILAEMKYGNLKVDELEKKFKIESNYSSVKVSEISENFESLEIYNSRGGYKLGLNENAAFKFNGYAKRGDISIPRLENEQKRVENTDKYIEGSYGRNPSSTIDIEVKEGSVQIYFD